MARTKPRSAYLKAIAADNSLAIEAEAMELWLKDLDNPFRWSLRPLLQFLFSVLLHVVWFFKRLPLPQFSAHGPLQATICWFCKYFVSVEASQLILRHYATESNVLNFLANNSLASNSAASRPAPLELYPRSIEEMREHSFVDHDQELFRIFAELGTWERPSRSRARDELNWNTWRPIQMSEFQLKKRKTQVMDFESAHALFMCLFCFLLTREEYRDAINGFNLDQSIAIRIGEITGKPGLAELAYNKYPHYLIGPWNLGQRFLMHGFFTEYLYAELEALRQNNSSIS